jgi:hypothetical protein
MCLSAAKPKYHWRNAEGTEMTMDVPEPVFPGPPLDQHLIDRVATNHKGICKEYISQKLTDGLTLDCEVYRYDDDPVPIYITKDGHVTIRGFLCSRPQGEVSGN